MGTNSRKPNQEKACLCPCICPLWHFDSDSSNWIQPAGCLTKLIVWFPSCLLFSCEQTNHTPFSRATPYQVGLNGHMIGLLAQHCRVQNISVMASTNQHAWNVQNQLQDQSQAWCTHIFFRQLGVFLTKTLVELSDGRHSWVSSANRQFSNANKRNILQVCSEWLQLDRFPIQMPCRMLIQRFSLNSSANSCALLACQTAFEPCNWHSVHFHFCKFFLKSFLVHCTDVVWHQW